MSDDGVMIEVARLDQRVTTVEREVSDLKRHRDDHAMHDSERWDTLLVAFGELKAKVEGMNGKMAGLLVAGMLLAAVVAVVAQYAMSNGAKP